MEQESSSDPPAHERDGDSGRDGSSAPPTTSVSGVGVTLPSTTAADSCHAVPSIIHAAPSPSPTPIPLPVLAAGAAVTVGHVLQASPSRHSVPSPLPLPDESRRAAPLVRSGNLILNAASSSAPPETSIPPPVPAAAAALTLAHIIHASPSFFAPTTGAEEEPPLPPPPVLSAAAAALLLMGPSSPASLMGRRRPARWQRLCGVCGQAEPTWFIACCITEICEACLYSAPVDTSRCQRLAPGFAVPIPPPFRLASGQFVPARFISFHHPLWQIYRYVEDTSFVLVGYYNTEDAHHREEFGVQFRVEIICRDTAAGPRGTSWRWRHSYRATLPLTYPLHISCRVVTPPPRP